MSKDCKDTLQTLKTVTNASATQSDRICSAQCSTLVLLLLQPLCWTLY